MTSPLDWSSIPPIVPVPGISGQTHQAERMTVIRYVYEPGSRFPNHSHVAEQVTVVLTGEIVFTIGGADVTVGAGQTIVIPSDVPHSARVAGTLTVETVNVLAPRREDPPKI